MGNFSRSLCTETWEDSHSKYTQACEELFLCMLQFCGLVDTSPIALQKWVFWETIPLMVVLKVGVLDVQSKLFTPQGEDGS